MDPTRFDNLLRSLSISPSRRAAVRLLGGLVLGGPLALGTRAAGAHNTLKRCKKIEDKAKRKKCVKKAKRHNAQHAAEGGVTPECTTNAQCDDGLVCNGVETCGPDGTCQAGTPPDCDDAIACTADACVEGSGDCTHTADDNQCDGQQICDPQAGCRCPDDAPDLCGDVCIQSGAQCSLPQEGACAGKQGSLVCIGNDVQCQSPDGYPMSELCNNIDDDCDGFVDEGASCPDGQRCENGGCCTVDGFGTEHACTSDTECCSGNCVTDFTGSTTCRPAGCLPKGVDCGGDPSVCCSFTCAGTCQ